MFVIVSWVSFMVKPEVVPGRSILNALKKPNTTTIMPKLIFLAKAHQFVVPYNVPYLSVQNWSQFEKQITD